jgi:A/G-specific adenine glycosylase
VEFTCLTEILLKWYSTNKRALPWRQTNDPYRIWLSEVILQQTRISQGLPYYYKFVKVFPTLLDLCEADEQEVLLNWQGLGYYSRARNLHRCSKIIFTYYNGTFPGSYNELVRLPGIGPYTAAAIASISFKEPKPVLDGNVFRVLSRLFDIKENISTGKGRKHFDVLANAMIPSKNPGDFNQAIMEFGALQCVPKNPDCESCVLNLYCISFSRKNQNTRPVKLKKIQKSIRYFNYLVLENDAGLYLKKRKENDIWKGLYDFYLIESDTDEVDPAEFMEGIKLINNYTIQKGNIRKYRHVLTHQIVVASFYRIIIDKCNLFSLNKTFDNGQFYKINEIEKIPKPVLIDNYLKEEIF